jgi:hypothetical protein
MQPLRVSAYLATDLAVSDDWSPSLDALLIKLLLDERGLACSNPTPEDAARNQPVIDSSMPIAKGLITANMIVDGELRLQSSQRLSKSSKANGEWYWKTSSPQYLYDSDSIETIHKRWDQQDRSLDWKGKRRNWSVSETNTKSWTILIPERSTPRIDWYCVGDANEIRRLTRLCSGLAKKRRTQVSRWEVEAISEDWHLWRGDSLMRSMPMELLDEQPRSFTIRNWAWRPPTHLPENVTLCYMPVDNVQKVQSVYGCA